jgi:TonB-linked SusC/RagA family outer membrane protein
MEQVYNTLNKKMLVLKRLNGCLAFGKNGSFINNIRAMKRNYRILSFFILLIIRLNSFGQGNIIIKGSITSKTNGETLVGVNISELSADNRVINGNISDINGQYVIRVKSLSNRLMFSFIGYKSQVVAIANRSSINIVLEEDVRELETVTITAKITQNDGVFNIPKREITTATQRINTKEFEGVQVTSIDEAIQGRIAGLDIVSNSGDPGSGTSMRIRGASSINGNTAPLIVINGVPFESQVDQNFDYANSNQEQYASMLSINPDDILDIAVLKDAASTAQWGSKGANGVLSITTKKGSRGPTSISYTYRFTRAVLPKGLNMLNGDDYTMLMKQEKFNPRQSEIAADVNEYNYDPSFSEYQDYNNNTDWVKEVSQTGFTHDHYLSASGGGERANYRVSGGFFKQDGTVIGQVLNRVSSRAYLDYSVSDKLKFISEFSFTFTDNQKNFVTESWGIQPSSMLDIAYRKMPNLSVYKQDASGNNTDVYYNILTDAGIDYSQKYLPNPVALAQLATNREKNYRIIPTFRIEYDILKSEVQSLQYKMYVSFDLNNTKTSMFLPKEALNLNYDDSKVERSESSNGKDLTVQTDNNITWIPTFWGEDHSIMFYGSVQTRSGRSNPLGISSFGSPSSEISDASATANLLSLGSTPSQWRSVAFLGRAHYSYKSKYIFDITYRRDGSTKFGSDKKFGDFPGVSAKWILSDEPFMNGTRKWLSMLGIRPSWGISGNQPEYEYLHYSKYASSGYYMDMDVVVPSSLPLANLQWEKLSSYNLGMDVGFFNDMLVFDLNYYWQHTDDLLMKNISLPSTTGYGGLSYQNVGSLQNNGWEINFNGNKVVKIRNFSMDITFNLANNKNTLVEMKNEVLQNYNADFGYNNGTYLQRLQKNNSYGSIYGFRYKGVYKYNDYVAGSQESAPVARDVKGNVITDNLGVPLPMKFGYGVLTDAYTFKGGDAIYEDINHDGNIDDLDIVYLGNSNPKLNGGFGATFRYKNLSLTTFFNFRLGNKIVNIAKMNAENMYYDNNQSVAVNYRWRKDGDDTNMPRALYEYGYNWLGSDRYVEDGSFLRFKYVTFRYSIQKKALEKFGLSSMNFYFTMNNLAVFSKYSGVDPEVSYGSLGMSKDESKTPRSKDFTLGITVGL